MPSIFRFSGLISARRDEPESAETVTALHPFDTTLGVNHPLFAGVEGVAFATQLHPHSGFGGSGVEHVTAGAGHDRVIKLGVDVCFHD